MIPHHVPLFQSNFDWAPMLVDVRASRSGDDDYHTLHAHILDDAYSFPTADVHVLRCDSLFVFCTCAGRAYERVQHTPCRIRFPVGIGDDLGRSWEHSIENFPTTLGVV